VKSFYKHQTETWFVNATAGKKRSSANGKKTWWLRMWWSYFEDWQLNFCLQLFWRRHSKKNSNEKRFF